MSRSIVILVVGLAALANGNSWANDDLASREPENTLRVTGEGKATAPPDMATVQTGVVTEAASATAALAANNQAMGEVHAVLKRHGVAAKDVQTTRFNVSPQYRHDDKGRRRPEIIGYRVTNQVRVRVRKLSGLGDVLDALVEAGSNRLSGIQFGIADPEPVRDQARTRAIQNAQHRARVYAQAAGVQVGRILSISEQPLARPPRPFEARALAAGDAAGVPVAPGEEEIRLTVNVVFALEQLTQ